ncbi:MAG: TlpA family protein disulfide reductase [Candidatus Rokubacteria bacterium]|nr:TlpA family protein disulfide reductase [Candidatus Rokubacteria bacterium]
MRSWASSAVLGQRRRDTVVRVVLGVVILGLALWALPTRRPGEQGGHHVEQAAVLDVFERAGVTEFKEGQRGPAFRLKTLEGRTATLEDYRGRLVVLNFWATWCQPCTIEMPTLEALWREYRERGLVVLGVSVDRGAPRSLIEPYVRNLRLTFPILLDPEVKTAGAWRVGGIPATFLVRPGGEVAGVAVGAREWNSAEMRALLESMLPAKAAGGEGTPSHSKRHSR